MTTAAQTTDPLDDVARACAAVEAAELALSQSAEQLELDEARRRRNEAIAAAARRRGRAAQPLSAIARAAGVSRTFAQRVVDGKGDPNRNRQR
jgi:hypothetical protein